MKEPNHDLSNHVVSVFRAWLDEPIEEWKCAAGWILSLALFVGLVALLGGPTESDSTTSIFSTWAIAHGEFSCAYPHASTLAAPLYPLLSGGVVALLRIGSHTAFPNVAHLGPHCSSSVKAILNWSIQARAWQRTLQVGELSWVVLIGGLVAMLRTSSRGRRGWEPFTLVVLALSLPVAMPLVEDFHPQDLVAFGLAMAALACVRRDSWTWAGVLIGLAFESQQFTILVAVTMLAIAPRGRRLRFATGAIGAVAAIGIPLVAISSGRALKSVLVGTGLSPSLDRTLLVEIRPGGTVLTYVARFMPILTAFGFSLWVVRRIGQRVLAADSLIAIVTVALCLRLIFELNLWGYYFMPLSVTLVLLDVVKGRIRGSTIAWLALVALVFNPVLFYQSATGRSYDLVPFRGIQVAFLAVALMLILWDSAHRRMRWYLVAWFTLAAVAFGANGWMYGPPHEAFPLWFWQIVLLSSAIALSMGPISSTLFKSSADVDATNHPRS